MIVLDTNIIGTFARVGAMDLLFALFPNDEIGIVAAVYAELVAGVCEGRQFLQPTVELVRNGKLKLFALTAEEVVLRVQLPNSLDEGEGQSIAVCRTRGAAFLTNDRRARNYCQSEGIEVFDLPDVLRALWKLGCCSKRKVRQLIAEIENNEVMVIKHKDRIFDR